MKKYNIYPSQKKQDIVSEYKYEDGKKYGLINDTWYDLTYDTPMNEDGSYTIMLTDTMQYRSNPELFSPGAKYGFPKRVEEVVPADSLQVDIG